MKTVLYESYKNKPEDYYMNHCPLQVSLSIHVIFLISDDWITNALEIVFTIDFDLFKKLVAEHDRA